MDKKMTSGEIAKKTGVSQKTIRLYDEKGLLKPTDYTEGNYRLYDKEALSVLEKIIALKQIGFSLEEIHQNLSEDSEVDITETLNRQLDILIGKKYEIEKAIASIRSVLVRESEPDWDSVADIVKMMQIDQGADENHFKALKHHASPEDWYVMIYKNLGLRANARVLDLGCGYAKLWRNSWNTIPENMQIDCYDLHGSWADDFETYLAEHKDTLAEGTAINLYFEDVEAQETWESIGEREAYDFIVAHYLTGFIKDLELFMERVADALTPGGMFSVNVAGASREHAFWQDIFTKLQLKTDFMKESEGKSKKRLDSFLTILEKYFTKVENTVIDNWMRYEDAEELFARLLERYPENKKYLTDKERVIKEYFVQELEEQGAIVVPTSSDFQHCFK